MKHILYTDGASRGNPGPAAIGIVIADAQGNEVEAIGETIGQTTNNEAEYHALLRGLERAAALWIDELEVRTDSELLARQVKGAYRVRAQNLKPLWEQTRTALARFKNVNIAIIPRELNCRADELANEALDRTRAKA